MHRARLVFLGSDAIALPLLQALVTDHASRAELVAVFTQPDRRTGRGMKLAPNEIKQWAEAAGIPVFQPEKPGPDEAAWLRDQQIDLALVMAYGHLLRPEHLDAPRLGMVNFHASLLPHLRGASPIQTSLATGERETGVSLMRIVKRMDAGAVADQERVPITAESTTPGLWDALAAACVPLLARNLGPLLDGTATFSEQDEARASYCRILFKTDAYLDFSAPAVALDSRIRAFQPWPGALFPYAGQEIKVGDAQIVEATGNAQPGTVLRADSRLIVQCGQGQLELTQLQRPGGKMLAADAFLRGLLIPVGTVLESRAMDPLVAKKPFRYVDHRPVVIA